MQVHILSFWGFSPVSEFSFLVHFTKQDAIKAFKMSNQGFKSKHTHTHTQIHKDSKINTEIEFKTNTN